MSSAIDVFFHFFHQRHDIFLGHVEVTNEKEAVRSPDGTGSLFLLGFLKMADERHQPWRTA